MHRLSADKMRHIRDASLHEQTDISVDQRVTGNIGCSLNILIILVATICMCV